MFTLMLLSYVLFYVLFKHFVLIKVVVLLKQHNLLNTDTFYGCFSVHTNGF